MSSSPSTSRTGCAEEQRCPQWIHVVVRDVRRRRCGRPRPNLLAVDPAAPGAGQGGGRRRSECRSAPARGGGQRRGARVGELLAAPRMAWTGSATSPAGGSSGSPVSVRCGTSAGRTGRPGPPTAASSARWSPPARTRRPACTWVSSASGVRCGRSVRSPRTPTRTGCSWPCVKGRSGAVSTPATTTSWTTRCWPWSWPAGSPPPSP